MARLMAGNVNELRNLTVKSLDGDVIPMASILGENEVVVVHFLRRWG